MPADVKQITVHHLVVIELFVAVSMRSRSFCFMPRYPAVEGNALSQLNSSR
jgi:hypothetical protein